MLNLRQNHQAKSTPIVLIAEGPDEEPEPRAVLKLSSHITRRKARNANPQRRPQREEDDQCINWSVSSTATIVVAPLLTDL